MSSGQDVGGGGKGCRMEDQTETLHSTASKPPSVKLSKVKTPFEASVQHGIGFTIVSAQPRFRSAPLSSQNPNAISFKDQIYQMELNGQQYCV